MQRITAFCTLIMRSNTNAYNRAPLFSSVRGGRRKSVTTIKVIGRKTLNKAETFEEKGLEESLRVDEREVEEKRRDGRGEGKKNRSFITHQMMNPECTLQS